MASGKRGTAFDGLQIDLNQGKVAGKIWKVVLDGGIRWNSLYQMIVRALALREALDSYASKLRESEHSLDLEVYRDDYISPDEWKTLAVMADQLEPLFRLTKDLEGNPDIHNPTSSSHGALWELLPLFEGILSHFEDLQTLAAAGSFNQRIQQLITLAWTKANEYYGKTDVSIAWMAALVLHPRWKWQYFDQHWTRDNLPFLRKGKLALKKLWEDDYKGEVIVRVEERTPELEAPKAYKVAMLERLAPPLLNTSSSSRTPRAASRRD